MSRPTIALAMIVKNEAENLPRLFKSIQGCFDEIHITDTGSTDNTVEIAKSFGAIVHHFEWCDDFAKARNASFEPIKTDYIMWMDGDDELSSPESFILWRDHCMYLATYWLATYHYALDEKKNPTCSFVRERVFKNGMGFKWRYPVHEGVVPLSPYGQVQPQMTNSWVINHLRSQEDINKDRSRNLNILKELDSNGKIDPRMTYYYGKELFEMGKASESIFQLGKALSTATLEMHDRVLAMQYICYAYMQTDQWSQAIQMAQQGVLLDPNRAEFWVILGDSFIKIGRPIDAIPFYQAAMSCQLKTPGNEVIFRAEGAYRVYPKNQLARIYANLAAFDLALETIEGLEDPGSEEIRKEVEKIKKLATGFVNAKKCQDIVITTPPVTPYSFDRDTMKEKALGGSETALVEMAYWLKQKAPERRVIVFNMRDAEKTIDGVEYIPVNKASEYFSEHEPYVHIAWRHTNKLTNAKTFIWNHDLQTQGLENTSAYDYAMALTPFHADYMHITQKVPYEKIWLTRNGLDPKKFEGLPLGDKERLRFVFGSSPDRGLDRAMLVLDRVRQEYPELTLHVHYGIEHLGKYGLGALQEKLEKMLKERESWVVYHGATPQKELMESYAKSAYCIQPSDWIETSMITAMELTCCGVFPMIRAVGGVKDTLSVAAREGMAMLIDSDCITEDQFDYYAKCVKEAIASQAYKRVQVDAKMLSWELVAQDWLTRFGKELIG